MDFLHSHFPSLLIKVPEKIQLLPKTQPRTWTSYVQPKQTFTDSKKLLPGLDGSGMWLLFWEGQEIQQQRVKDLRDQARDEKFLFSFLPSFWTLLQALKKEIKKNSPQEREQQGLWSRANQSWMKLPGVCFPSKLRRWVKGSSCARWKGEKELMPLNTE